MMMRATTIVAEMTMEGDDSDDDGAEETIAVMTLASKCIR
jgi:hypothetical protein